MIIHSIDYKNIGNKPTLAIGFKPGVNIITGPNDSGKTTLKNAILFALTGMASDRDKKELHTAGIPNPRSEITMIVDEHKIIRQLTPTPAVYYDGFKKNIGKSKDIDALYDVGFDRKTLKMICDNYNFFNLSGQEQQEILFKYFSGATEINIADYGITDDNEKIHFFGMNASNIAVYYKKFYDMRRDLKKEIEIFEISRSNKVNEAMSLNINTTLVELEKERTETNSKIKSNIYFNNKHSDLLHSLDVELNEEEKKVFVPKNKSQIDSINRDGLANKKLIEELDKLNGMCPLDYSIECKSASQLEKVKQNKISDNNRLRQMATKLMEEDNNSKTQFEAHKATTINALMDKILETKEAIAKEKEMIETNNKTINEENAIVFQQVEAIDRKIAILKHKQELEQAITAIDKDIAVKKALLSKYEIYLELTGDGDKSIKNKLVSGNIGDFFKDVTEYSREFGYEFIQNPSSKEFEILVNNKTSNMLSSSGKIKASIAIQVAIAKKSGYNIIMADDIEKCEQGNLMKIINALTESGVQAFVFGHNLNKAMFPTTCNIIELA